jgi:uncharacterized protein YkwD
MLASILAIALMQQRQADIHAAEAQAATALYYSLNTERRSQGLAPLSLDPLLDDAAIDHVVDMAQSDYFAHVSPTGVSPWDRMRRYGCSYSYAGENLALAGNESQADGLLYQSPPHRENILNANYTRVGIAVMFAQNGQLIFVEDFAG